MLLVAAFLLALFYLPAPWGVIAVGVATILEIGEAWAWWWWSHRRKPAIGIEAMIGASATVVGPCRPLGQVRIQGELWQARCDAGADAGDVVEVVGVDGLTLITKPVAA